MIGPKVTVSIVIHRLHVWLEGLPRGRKQLRPPGVFGEGGQAGQSDSTAQVIVVVNSWTIHVLFPLYQGRSDQPRRYCEPLTGENDSDGEDDILMPGCTKVYYDTFKINIPWLVPIVIKHNDDNLQCIYDDIPTFVKSTAYFQMKLKWL